MFDLTLFAGAVVLQLSSAGLPIPGAKPILVGAGPLDGSNWSGPAVFPPAPWIMHPRTFRAPLRPRLTLSAPVLCARGWRASRHNADEPYGAYLQSQGNPEVCVCVCVCACVHVCVRACARLCMDGVPHFVAHMYRAAWATLRDTQLGCPRTGIHGPTTTCTAMECIERE